MNDIFDILAIEYEGHLQLCDALETIADGLPHRTEKRLCACVANLLRVNMPRHHRIEEEILFPLLRRRVWPEDNFNCIADEMIREHVADQASADELAESLEMIAAGESPDNPDMTGYMLRAFFESYRRHILLENIIVLPLARARLTQSDRAMLAESIHILTLSATNETEMFAGRYDFSNVVFLSNREQRRH